LQQNPWVALDATTDRQALARVLARAHHDALAGAAPPTAVREIIAQSWRRSDRAGVDPRHGFAPHVLSPDAARQRFAAHPLAVGKPLLRELLDDVRDDAKQVVLVCDADGTILWVDGEPAVLDGAQEINLTPGAGWSEGSVGTNAMGTALALAHPVQVFSAEHFAEAVHRWTCSAAPVRDPETGETVGVIDLSGELATAHPHSLALVSAAARMLETGLAHDAERRQSALRERFGASVAPGRGKASALVAPSGRVLLSDDPGWLGERVLIPAGGGLVELQGGSTVLAEPVGAGGTEAFLIWRARDARPSPAEELVTLTTLGYDRGAFGFGGETVGLTRRHTEILALLLLRPEGLTAEQLAIELYGDFGKPVSVRAELSRLRRLLGDNLETHPYRIGPRVRWDFSVLERLAEMGRVREALERYVGTLLPASEVPAIVAARERLDFSLRGAALASEDPDLLWAWLHTPSGADDVFAWRRLADLLAQDDRRRVAVLSQLRRLSQPRRRHRPALERRRRR
jgi:hypothetical protein